jgi:uncharacterized membrane protein
MMITLTKCPPMNCCYNTSRWILFGGGLQRKMTNSWKLLVDLMFCHHVLKTGTQGRNAHMIGHDRRKVIVVETSLAVDHSAMMVAEVLTTDSGETTTGVEVHTVAVVVAATEVAETMKGVHSRVTTGVAETKDMVHVLITTHSEAAVFITLASGKIRVKDYRSAVEERTSLHIDNN